MVVEVEVVVVVVVEGVFLRLSEIFHIKEKSVVRHSNPYIEHLKPTHYLDTTVS